MTIKLIKIINVQYPINDANELREKSWNKDLATPTKNTIAIIDEIKKGGDEALLRCVEKFDNAKIDSFIVTKKEIKEAYGNVTPNQIDTIKYMKSKLEESEQAIKNNLKDIKVDSDNIRINKKVIPISRIGCYIPGGKARYPSTVIMCAIPAKVAGVKQIVAISPPMKNGKIDPFTLVAADICGVNEFYKIGGAHGIAALAYGTKTIKKVDKIVGPGGLYVSIAKSIISKDIAIDMLAGPTELLIYANEKDDPRIVALDLISQAEHSEDTVCGAVTNSNSTAKKIIEEIYKIINFGNIDRKDIVEKSLNKNGFIAICDKDEKVIEFINEFAPEHLEILDNNERNIIKEINNAGLTLIGNYTPSSISDYCLGSNHVLPTYKFAKSRSSLSVLDFIKIVNTVEIEKQTLEKISPMLKEITLMEGLSNHYEAAYGRIQ
ncbi:MAG TPA: histidinol dehydrogenase [Candidatus Nitrosocosmicus sp.]|nr:histidinol dehydrogenase [Candidatus Nitrosocosmicus sp.]